MSVEFTPVIEYGTVVPFATLNVSSVTLNDSPSVTVDLLDDNTYKDSGVSNDYNSSTLK